MPFPLPPYLAALSAAFKLWLASGAAMVRGATKAPPLDLSAVVVYFTRARFLSLLRAVSRYQWLP